MKGYKYIPGYAKDRYTYPDGGYSETGAVGTKWGYVRVITGQLSKSKEYYTMFSILLDGRKYESIESVYYISDIAMVRAARKWAAQVASEPTQ